MRRLLTAVVVIAALAIAATVAWQRYGEQAAQLLPDECVAVVGTGESQLKARVNPEQARNASMIAAIGIERGLPARAVTIALATAFQESKLYNIDYGDRDSLGLFQQRPSQGWGTRAQILDPTYATNAFYDALVKVEGYETMEITVAAQKVQRSAFPDAYADHEPGARALASALTGQSPEAFSCRFRNVGTGTSAKVADRISTVFGDSAGTPVVAGRSVTVMPRDAEDADTRWAVAHWVVARANRLGIASVKVDGRIWTGDEGWQDASTGDGQVVITVRQSEN